MLDFATFAAALGFAVNVDAVLARLKGAVSKRSALDEALELDAELLLGTVSTSLASWLRNNFPAIQWQHGVDGPAIGNGLKLAVIHWLSGDHDGWQAIATAIKDWLPEATGQEEEPSWEDLMGRARSEAPRSVLEAVFKSPPAAVELLYQVLRAELAPPPNGLLPADQWLKSTGKPADLLHRDVVFASDFGANMGIPKAWQEALKSIAGRNDGVVDIIKGDPASGKSFALRLIAFLTSAAFRPCYILLPHVNVEPGVLSTYAKHAASTHPETAPWILLDDAHHDVDRAGRLAQSVAPYAHVVMTVRSPASRALESALQDVGRACACVDLDAGRTEAAAEIVRRAGRELDGGRLARTFVGDFNSDLAVFKAALANWNGTGQPCLADAQVWAAEWLGRFKFAQCRALLAVASTWQFEIALPLDFHQDIHRIESGTVDELVRQAELVRSGGALGLARHPRLAGVIASCASMTREAADAESELLDRLRRRFPGMPSATRLDVACLVAALVNKRDSGLTIPELHRRLVYLSRTASARRRCSEAVSIAALLFEASGDELHAFESLVHAASVARRLPEGVGDAVAHLAQAERVYGSRVSRATWSPDAAGLVSNYWYQCGYVCFLRDDYSKAASLFLKSAGVAPEGSTSSLMSAAQAVVSKFRNEMLVAAREGRELGYSVKALYDECAHMKTRFEARALSDPADANAARWVANMLVHQAHMALAARLKGCCVPQLLDEVRRTPWPDTQSALKLPKWKFIEAWADAIGAPDTEARQRALYLLESVDKEYEQHEHEEGRGDLLLVTAMLHEELGDDRNAEVWGMRAASRPAGTADGPARAAGARLLARIMSRRSGAEGEPV